MQKINNNEIFYRGKPNVFHITQDIRTAIKDIISENYEGGYVERGLLWSFENNENILKKFDHDPVIFFNNIAIAMQFIVRSTKMEQLDPTYVETNKIEDYHIRLLNRLYIDWSETQNEIYTGNKRPFGNSYMQGDIYEEMRLAVDADDEYEDEDGELIERMDEDEAEAIAQRVYNEVLDLALHVFKNENLPFSKLEYAGKFDPTIKLHEFQEKYLNHEWTIAYSEFMAILRDEKIDEILNDKI